MSRLHRQKLRLRSMQREEGIIDHDGDDIDRESFAEDGSVHTHLLEGEAHEPDEGDELERRNHDEPAATKKRAKRKPSKRRK